MIDAHMHAVHTRLPGSLRPDRPDPPPETVAAELRGLMADSETELLLGMGHVGGENDDPLGIAATLRIAELLPGLRAIGTLRERTICSESSDNCRAEKSSA